MSSAVAIARRHDLSLTANLRADERWIRRRVGLAWSLLIVNVLTFYPSTWSGLPLAIPIPSSVGKVITQGSLGLALLVAIMANRRLVIRPSVFLLIMSLLVVVAFAVILEPGHFGTIYRTFRFAGFVATLWLLTPFWGRRDMLLVRCYLVAISIVLGTVLLGLVVAPRTAYAAGRLEGALWPYPPTQVAHFAAVVIGLIVLLWLSGLASRRLCLAAVLIGTPMLLLTHTRTALLAMVAGIFVAGLSLFTVRTRARKLFAVASVAVSLGAITLSGVVTAWLARGESSTQLTSLTGRTTVWSAILGTPRNLFETIFGFGMSNLSFNGLSIDSNWLGAYLDFGLIGVILCAAMLVFVLISAYFQPAGPERAIALFLATFCLLSSFTETGLSDPSLYLLELTLAASVLVPAVRGRSPANAGISRRNLAILYMMRLSAACRSGLEAAMKNPFAGYPGESGTALTSYAPGVGKHAKFLGKTGLVNTPRPDSDRRHAIDAPRRARGWLIATVSSVAGIAGLSIWIGPAPIVGPWDVFTLLNGAYRIYEGQIPSTDFSNPIGPLVYGLTALGMHLQHAPSLAAVTYGQVIFLIIIASLAWAIAWRRLPALYAALFTVFVALLAVSVRPLGYSPWTTTYAMLYNRDGWLLYSTLLLLVLLGRRTPSTSQSRVADGFLLGLMLGMMFYDKITFFIAGVVAVGIGLALSTLPRSPRLGAAALSGFAVVGVFMRLAFGVHTTSYIDDFMQAAKVQVSAQRTGLLAHAIIWTAPVIVVSIILLAGLLIMIRRRSEPLGRIVRLSVAAAYIVGSSLLISAGNADEKGNLPALAVVPLLIIAFLGPALPKWAGGSSTARAGAWPVSASPLLLAGLALLLVGATGPVVGEDSLGLGKAISFRGYDARPPATQRFDAGLLRDFVVPANAQWQTAYRTARELPAMIDNGLSLLRRNIRPGDSVFTLAYTDPFSPALGLPLSRCGPLWWDLGYDFNRTHHPSAQCAIGNADWVIIPRMIAGQGCCQQTVSVMRALYSGYLSQHYKQVRQTPDWILLHRMR